MALRRPEKLNRFLQKENETHHAVPTAFVVLKNFADIGEHWCYPGQLKKVVLAANL